MVQANINRKTRRLSVIVRKMAKINELFWMLCFFVIGFLLGICVLGLRGQLNIEIIPPQLSTVTENSSYDILGSYYPTPDKIIIYPGRVKNMFQFQETMYHEYCHYLVDQDTENHFCNERICEGLIKNDS